MSSTSMRSLNTASSTRLASPGWSKTGPRARTHVPCGLGVAVTLDLRSTRQGQRRLAPPSCSGIPILAAMVAQ